MRNKKRIKRKKSKARKQLTAPPLQYSAENLPFDGLSKAEVVEVMKRIGQEFGEQYPELLENLREQVLRFEPLSLLAFLSFQYLTTLVGSNLDWQNEKPLSQHHVELTQALILQHQREEFGFDPIHGTQFAKFADLVQETAKAFAIRRFSALDATSSQEEFKRLGALEQMRGETQVVRNWGYPQQVARIVTDLFSELETSIEKRIGVRIGHLVRMLLNLGDRIEERTTQHRLHKTDAKSQINRFCFQGVSPNEP